MACGLDADGEGFVCAKLSGPFQLNEAANRTLNGTPDSGNFIGDRLMS